MSIENPNFYFVRKNDFDSPNLYNLSIFKPYARSRIRTFIPNQGTQQAKNNYQKIRMKFLSPA
jgi:hypothetical protein